MALSPFVLTRSTLDAIRPSASNGYPKQAWRRLQTGWRRCLHSHIFTQLHEHVDNLGRTEEPPSAPRTAPAPSNRGQSSTWYAQTVWTRWAGRLGAGSKVDSSTEENAGGRRHQAGNSANDPVHEQLYTSNPTPPTTHFEPRPSTPANRRLGHPAPRGRPPPTPRYPPRPC